MPCAETGSAKSHVERMQYAENVTNSPHHGQRIQQASHHSRTKEYYIDGTKSLLGNHLILSILKWQKYSYITCAASTSSSTNIQPVHFFVICYSKNENRKSVFIFISFPCLLQVLSIVVTCNLLNSSNIPRYIN